MEIKMKGFFEEEKGVKSYSRLKQFLLFWLFAFIDIVWLLSVEEPNSYFVWFNLAIFLTLILGKSATKLVEILPVLKMNKKKD